MAGEQRASSTDGPIRAARVAIWILAGAFPGGTALSIPVDRAADAGTLPWWLPVIVQVASSLAYLALIVVSGKLAGRLNRRAGDWTAAAIGVPVVSSLVLSFLPPRPEPVEDEERVWEVAVLALGLLLLSLGTGMLIDQHQGGLLAIAAALLLVRVGAELHRRGFLLRGVLVALGLLWVAAVVDTVRRPAQLESGWFGALFSAAFLAALTVLAAGIDARRRCLRWRRWVLLTVVAPFAAPFVLAFGRTPTIGGVAAASLVEEYGELFEELVEAHVRKSVAEETVPNASQIAAASAATTHGVLMLKHRRLTDEELERVAELYARR